MQENKEKLKEAAERNEAFLALLQHEAGSEDYRSMKSLAEKGSHPPNEMLRDYVLDRLDREKNRRVMMHLAVCEICTEALRLIREDEEGIMEAADKELILTLDKTIGAEDWAALANVPPENWIEKLKQKFSDLAAEPWVKPLACGLAAACLLLYLIIPGRSDIGKMIERSYETAITQNMTFPQGKAGDAFTLPWSDKGALGFMSLKDHAPGIRAFGAGLWAGRSELRHIAPDMPETGMPDSLSSGESGAEGWTGTEWELCFRLGRWSFLMRAACLSDTELSPDFWKQQAQISENFVKKIDEHPDIFGKSATAVRVSLEQTGAVLKDAEGKPDERQRKRLISDMDNLIAYIMR